MFPDPFRQDPDGDSASSKTSDFILFPEPLSDERVGPRWMFEELETDNREPEENLLSVEEESARLQISSTLQLEMASTPEQSEFHNDRLISSHSTQKQDAMDGLLANLDVSGPSNRVDSQSSASSSLEPLSEAFEVPTLPSYSPVSARRSPTPETSHVYFKRPAETESAQDSRPSLSTQGPSARRHKRAKSDTPLELAGPKDNFRQHKSNEDGPPGIQYSHFHLQGFCARPGPASLPPSPAGVSSSLIADVNVAKSRLLITKTHCFYPEQSSLIPFSSCLLGFQLVFHSSDPKARIKHSQIKLTTRPPSGIPASDTPIIKAIYPTQGVIHKTGDGTFVQRRDENSIGIRLGVDPYGAMVLSHTQTRCQERYTSPYLLGSGIETNKLLITMNEDSTSHDGVPPSLAFAILLYLPSQSTKAFDANLTIETSVGNELSASLRKMWASPKVWKLSYDGRTELGNLRVHKSQEKDSEPHSKGSC